MMARRVPRRTPETAQAEHAREAFGGAAKGRSALPLPTAWDTKLQARLRAGGPNPLTSGAVRAYQNEYVLSGGAETVTLTYLPLEYSEHVYLNGVYQREGPEYDWTRDSGSRTVNVLTPMDARAGDILTVEYLYYAGVPVAPNELSNATVRGGTGWTAFLATHNPTLPTGVQDGDLLVLEVASQSTSISGLSAWTLSADAAGTGTNARLYTLIYDSGSYSAPTISVAPGPSTGTLSRMVAWANGAVGGSATHTGGLGIAHSLGGITTTTKNAVVHMLFTGSDDFRPENLSNAALPNLETNRTSAIIIGAGNQASSSTYDTLENPGSTGSTSFTSGGNIYTALAIVSII